MENKFYEWDLEEILYTSLKNGLINDLCEKGLCLRYSIYHRYFTFRQLNLGEYGIADIVLASPILNTKNSEGKRSLTIKIIVFELKNGLIDESAILQSIRYSNAIEKFIFTNYPDVGYIETTKIVIGRELKDTPDVEALESYVDGLELYKFQYSIDGIKFESIGSNSRSVGSGLLNTDFNYIAGPAGENTFEVLRLKSGMHFLGLSSKSRDNEI